jgi:toxin-antitoxin system PIN domain toxin
LTALLDGNLLVALADPDHQHHDAAQRWLAGHPGAIASCPITTQGTLLRVRLRAGVSASQADRHLAAITADSRHEFWPDSLPYAEVSLRPVIGHRQNTDAYLAQLARSHSGTLATFDRGLAAAHPDVAELVPREGVRAPEE